MTILEPIKTKKPDFMVRFPDDREKQLDQDEEWCLIKVDGQQEKKVRFHDYDQVYCVPGFYEFLFYDKLKCNSPCKVCGMLEQEMKKKGDSPSEIKALDVGAGNGMVGEELRSLGSEEVVGIDIIEEAKEAAVRDRPGVYDQYFVADLTDLPGPVRKDLEERDFNTLTTVAALGFGDIPAEAFAEAYNFVENSGWLAFNIKEDFLDESEDQSGFSLLVRRMIREGKMEPLRTERFQHRVSVAGQPLYYVGMVARKLGDVPKEWLKEL